jgi:small subunit ribosomal protein S17
MTTPSSTSSTPRPRHFSGTVVSAGNDKTIVVKVTRRLRHPLYGKLYARSRRFQVHDELNKFAVGDVVEFTECRPLSKHKRWTVQYPTPTT